MKLSKLKTDDQKSKNGVWVTVHAGFRMLIARINNPKYREYIRQRGRALQRQIRRGLLDNDEMEKLTKDAISLHVLLGWEGLEDEDGKQIPYSPQKARALFDSHEELYDMVLEYANDAETFKQEDDEKLQGNSSGA